MQKEYAYDKKYLGLQKLSLLVVPFYSFLLFRRWDLPIIPALLAIIAVTVLLWYDLHRRERTTFVLDNEGVVRKYGHREKRIRFDEISRVRFLPAVPYQIRAKIESDGSAFRLGRDIVNISDLLLNLKIALDTGGLSSHYSRKEMTRSLLLAKHRDRHQGAPGQVEMGAAKIVACIVLNVAVLGSCLTLILHLQTGWWSTALVVWPFVLPAFFHFLSFRRFASRSKPELMIFPEYDIDEEKSLFNKVLIIGELILFAVTLTVLQIKFDILNIF